MLVLTYNSPGSSPKKIFLSECDDTKQFRIGKFSQFFSPPYTQGEEPGMNPGPLDLPATTLTSSPWLVRHQLRGCDNIFVSLKFLFSIEEIEIRPPKMNAR